MTINIEHPDRGVWRPPAYQYSLGQGIEDGFLATYKVHRVRTTVDAEGLRLQDAIEQGAEVFIPEDIEPYEIYTTPQFEREITLPDRTREMVRHLTRLLRRFGKMEKTMVFCVDMEHARLVARLRKMSSGRDWLSLTTLCPSFPRKEEGTTCSGGFCLTRTNLPRWWRLQQSSFLQVLTCPRAEISSL